ncbi:hypothetical protein RB594_007986 [Gaeumannomyces avenae]
MASGEARWSDSLQQLSDDTNSANNAPVNCFDSTTKLVVGGNRILLIPSPSQDPRDPVNPPGWCKAAVTGILILYSVSGLTIVIALGALIVFIKPEYEKAGITESQISGLLTYPNLLLGVGNIVSMPLAAAVGRRPVMLASTGLLVLSAILCATNQNFYWHLGARCLAALNAAQCEASVLLMWLSSIQVILNSFLVIACSYVADAVGWRAWYWIFVALAGLACVLTVLFVPETAYDRPIESFLGAGSSYKSAEDCEDPNTTSQHVPGSPLASPTSVTHINPSAGHGQQNPKPQPQTIAGQAHFATLATHDERPLDLDRYAPRTWTSNMRVFLGQIAAALIAVPLVGTAGDAAVKWLARRRRGVHEPERRLLTMILPILLAVLLTGLYGFVLADPSRFYWMAIAFTVDAYLYILLAASTAGTTFGVSNGIVNYIARIGAPNPHGIYAGLIAVFGLLGCVLY